MDSLSVDEIVAHYRFEPEIREIFVEGPTKQRIIEYYLHCIGAQDVCVRPIEFVHVDDSAVLDNGLEVGNRGRTIQLANELLSKMPDCCNRVLCIVDRDLDDCVPTVEDSIFLKRTDFPGIEVYVYDSAYLNKFLRLFPHNFPCDFEIISPTMETVLRRLFAFRVAKKVMGLNAPFPKVSGDVRLNGNAIVFDEDAFLNRFLGSHGERSQLEAFLAEASRIEGSLDGDPRKCMHGHDFQRVLLSICREYIRPTPGRTFELFGISLSLGLDHERLDEHALFREIKRRFGDAVIEHMG